MAAQLAPVYLDNNRITLQGDPKPNVEKIVRTAGKRPERVRVVRLKAQTDTDGRALAVTDVIDRSATMDPVYLRCFDSKAGGTNPAAPSMAPANQPSALEPSMAEEEPEEPSHGSSGEPEQDI